MTSWTIATNPHRSRGRTPPPTPAEVVAIAVTCVGTLGFAVYGYATAAPSTGAYVVSIIAVGLVVLRFRREPLPAALALALSVNALLHLAGGLVQVGPGGLYNVGIGRTAPDTGFRLLQYDHGVHAMGSFLAAMVLWTLLVRPSDDPGRRREQVALCFLAGIGVGGLNETVEFVATLVHHGAHVGGYTNTGWDLVANLVGASVAMLVATRQARRSATP